MRMLVIGGMHGNEPLGPTLVKLFKDKPVANVDLVLANGPALRANCRFVTQDLNRSFPGNIASAMYEEKRAAELVRLCEKYDVVLDFHNTHCPNNDCSFVGEGCQENLYDVSAWLGLKRVIVADYDCINKYASNCLSVEISLNSSRMEAQQWYEAIAELTGLSQLPKSKGVEKYRFVYRLTLEDKERFDLPAQKLLAFQALDKSLAAKLGVKAPAFPIFVADQYTPYNYGGLLNKIK